MKPKVIACRATDLINSRSLGVLLYLSTSKPACLEMPSKKMLADMFQEGWITSAVWTQWRRPKITDKGRVVLALALDACRKATEGSA